MTTTRIYVDTPLIAGETVALDERSRHHLLNVLRAKDGEEIVLFNGQGGEYSANLLVKGKTASAAIRAFHDINRESPLKLHLAQAISRGDRMDFTLQKAVELGVGQITPLYSERSLRKQDAKQSEKKFKHWSGIIISACDQSGRCLLPALNQPINIDEWLIANNNSHRYILDPSANGSFAVSNKNDITLIIGPEGGFSDREITQAKQHGCFPVTLGPRILRTETAGIAALTICQALAGDLLGNI
jgi:16S rRNA (uracil1498-N3)-methyltransferase